MLRRTATRGLNARIVSSWNEETSATTQSLGSASRNLLDQRVTDVSADSHPLTATAQQVSDQRGRRRLTLRSGHRDDWRLAEPIGELDLAENRYVALVKTAHDRRGRRHAGRENGTGELGGETCELGRLDEARPERMRRGDRPGQFRNRFFVRSIESNAMFAQHLDARQSAAP